jgi:peptidoglycan/LPS O-acetylase OafA/YrhL
MSKSIIRHGLHFLSLFFTGAALYVFKEHVDLSHRLALLISCLFLVSIGQKCFLVSYTLFISYIAVYLAYVPADCIRSFNKIGDYSYGIYIYAFPIQQSLVTLLPGISFFKYVYAFFPYNISSRNNIMAYA